MIESLVRMIVLWGLLIVSHAATLQWGLSSQSLLLSLPLGLMLLFRNRQGALEAIAACVLSVLLWSQLLVPLKLIGLIVLSSAMTGMLIGVISERFPQLVKSVLMALSACGVMWLLPELQSLVGMTTQVAPNSLLISFSVVGVFVFLVCDCFCLGMAEMTRYPVQSNDPWKSVKPSNSWYS